MNVFISLNGTHIVYTHKKEASGALYLTSFQPEILQDFRVQKLLWLLNLTPCAMQVMILCTVIPALGQINSLSMGNILF